MKLINLYILILLLTGFIYCQANNEEANISDKNTTTIKRWSNVGGIGPTGLMNFLISYQLKRPITIGSKKFHPYFNIGKRYDDFGMLYNSIDRSSGFFGLFELHSPIKLGKSTSAFGGVGWGKFVYRKDFKEYHEDGYSLITHFISETAFIISCGMQFNINNWALIQPRLYFSPKYNDPLIFTMNAGFKTESWIYGSLTLPLAWLGFHAFFILIGGE